MKKFFAYLELKPVTQKALLILVGVFLLVLFTFLLPPAVDWYTLYRPAALALASGQSPFTVDRFSNAPWVLIPMLPLLLVSEAFGRAILALAALVSFLYIGLKFGAKPPGIIFFLISPQVIQSMLDGNVDWLAALGFILPPQIGLFFLAIKPQIGAAVAVFWLVEAWRKNGWIAVLKVFAPVTIALGVTFLLYGFWPLNYLEAFDWGGNTSLWPMSLPVGLALFITAIRKQDIRYAIAASPCFAPYLLLHSWIGPLIAIISATPEMIAAVIGLWAFIGIRSTQN